MTLPDGTCECCGNGSCDCGRCAECDCVTWASRLDEEHVCRSCRIKKAATLSPNVLKAGGRFVEVWLACPRENDYDPVAVDPEAPHRILDPRRGGSDDPRDPANWFRFELGSDGGGWALLLGADDYYGADLPWESWCLANGVAPGQPFKVRVECPSYGDEDADYGDWEIVEREPWDARRVADAWVDAIDFDAAIALGKFEAYARAMADPRCGS